MMSNFSVRPSSSTPASSLAVSPHPRQPVQELAPLAPIGTLAGICTGGMGALVGQVKNE